jgi:hypothetical protein
MNPTVRQRLMLGTLRPGPRHLPPGVRGGVGTFVHPMTPVQVQQKNIKPVTVSAKVTIGK